MVKAYAHMPCLLLSSYGVFSKRFPHFVDLLDKMRFGGENEEREGENQRVDSLKTKKKIPKTIDNLKGGVL